MGVSWGARFSPHIIVLILTVLAAVRPLGRTIATGIFAWWASSYTKVEYVMEEARPNDGSPYIAGHFEGSTEPRNLIGAMQGTTMFVKGVPGEAFEPGKRITVWHSERAPNTLVFGEDTNDVPVAVLPQLPGFVAVAGYLAWLFVTLVMGLRLTMWVASRWSRTFGTVPIGPESDRIKPS